MYDAGNFVSDVGAYFTLPRGWDEGQAKGWAQRLGREIVGFESKVLQRAADELIARRKDTRLPPIAECVKACVEAKRWLDIENSRSDLPVDESKKILGQFADDRVKLADDLIRCALGKQAAKEGWIVSLHDFCRHELSLPSGPKLEACKKAAREFDEAYRTAVRDQRPEARVLEQLGAKLLAKRKRLTDMVLGGR